MVTRFDSEKDYYELLGVKQNSTLKEIKKAFRKKAREHHPDHNGHKDDEEIKRINEAWSVLSNEEYRQNYDSARSGDRYAKATAQENWQDRERKEREEAKSREEKRRDEETLKTAREIKSKLGYYFEKMPGLKEKHFDLFLESLAKKEIQWTSGKVREYRRDGSIFLEDYGVFEHFLKNDASEEELEKILKVSSKNYVKAVMPLVSNQIEGLKVKFAFDNARSYFSADGTNKIRSIYLQMFENEVLMSRYDAIRNNPLLEQNDLVDPIYVCRLAQILSKGFKSGEYKIKISTIDKGEGFGSHSTNWMGYWIDDLSIGGLPIIKDRKSLLDKLGVF